MKRIGSIFLVLLIVLAMVFNPVLIGMNTRVLALTNEQRLMMYPAEFWAWQMAEWSSMGMQAQNLGEAMNYMNRNGDIDRYLQNVYQGFINDVTKTPRAIDKYFKATATFWERLFNGDLELYGFKDIVSGAADPASVWYVNPAAGVIRYSDFKSNVIETSDYVAYLNTVGSWGTISPGGAVAYLDSYLLEGNLDIGEYTYYTSLNDPYGFNAKKRKISDNTVSQVWGTGLSGTVVGRRGYLLIICWARTDGSLDESGNKYKAILLPVYQGTASGYQTVAHGGSFIANLDMSVNGSEIEHIVPISLDDYILDYSIASSDIAVGDYVGTVIDLGYLDEVNTKYQAVVGGTATVGDIALPAPGTQVKTETNNPAIADAIPDATVAAEVDTVDYPQVEQFKMPSGITTKFPFSIPWDLARAVQMLQYTAEVPVFTIPFRIESLNYSYDMVIDLTQFELLAKVTRFMVLACFIVGLIMATRALIKG